MCRRSSLLSKHSLSWHCSGLTKMRRLPFSDRFSISLVESRPQGSLRHRRLAVRLVEQIGPADPERALEIVRSIRCPTKDTTGNESNEDMPLFSQEALVAALPWVLFGVARHVSSAAVAQRYLLEMEQLVTLEAAGELEATRGRTPRELLKRILIGLSNSSSVFAGPARDLAVAGLTDLERWPFVGQLLECLLDPVRESAVWATNWTLSITRQPAAPGTLVWNEMVALRKQVYDVLAEESRPEELRCSMWEVLSASHHALHRAVSPWKGRGRGCRLATGVFWRRT